MKQRSPSTLTLVKAGLLVLLLLSTTACELLLDDDNTTSTLPQSATPIDVSVPGFSGSALLVVNTSTGLSNTSQSSGKLPTSGRILRTLQQIARRSGVCFSVRKNNTSQATKNKRLQQHTGPVQSLTASDTTASFLTYNFATEDESDPITIEATLRYSGSHCLLYVETGVDYLLIKDAQGINHRAAVDWSDIGERFDSEIYPRETALFGLPEDVDDNNKVILLYYNFNRGSLDENASTGFIAGYFYPGDLTPQFGGYSNEKDMVNMNIVCTSVTQNEETLAHEFTHLANYSERVLNRGLSQLDTWINEGLAECGAHVGLNNPLYSQIDRMKDDPYIRNGLIPLFEWTSTAQQYSLAYTFFQYVKDQSSQGEAIWGSIANHPYSDYRSIETLLTSESGSEFESFKNILVGFHMANIVNQPTGSYGYKGDPVFEDFGTLSAPSSSQVYLASGGAVYLYPSQSNLNDYIPRGSGSHIEFYRINP